MGWSEKSGAGSFSDLPGRGVEISMGHLTRNGHTGWIGRPTSVLSIQGPTLQMLNPPSGPIGVAATPLGCTILGRRLALEHNCTFLSRPSFPPGSYYLSEPQCLHSGEGREGQADRLVRVE